MTSTEASWLSATTLQNFSTTQLSGFGSNAAGLSANAMSALNVSNVAAFTSTAIAALATDSFNAWLNLAFAPLAGAKYGLSLQLYGVTTAQIASISTTYLSQLNSTTFDFLTKNLPQSSINAWTTDQIASINPSAIPAFYLNNLNNAWQFLTSDQIGAFTTQQILNINPSAYTSIGSNAAGLNSAQVAAMTTANFNSLATSSNTPLNYMSTAAALGISLQDLALITSTSQVAQLFPTIPVATLQGMTSAAVGALTGAQFAAALTRRFK